MSPNLLNILNDEEKEEIFFSPPFSHFFPSIKKDGAKRENVWEGETRRRRRRRRRILSTNQRDLCTVITNQTTARKTRSPFGCSETLIPICVYQVGAHEIFLLDKRFFSERSRVVYG